MAKLNTRQFAMTIQAASAFIAGILVTFSQSHNAVIGLIALIVMSAGWTFAFVIDGLANNEIRARVFRFVIAASSALMVAITFAALANQKVSSAPLEGALEEYAWGSLAAWGLLGAAVELILAFYAEKGSSRRRDHLISAGLGAGLGLAQLLTPATDSVTHVGFFGAYAVILAVHLGLAVASPAANASTGKFGAKKSAASKTAAKK